MVTLIFTITLQGGYDLLARMLNKSVNRTIIEVCIYRDNIDPLDNK